MLVYDVFLKLRPMCGEMYLHFHHLCYGRIIVFACYFLIWRALSNIKHHWFIFQLMLIQRYPVILDLMCTNLTVFEQFFTLPPGANNYSLDTMQTSMCSFRVNLTLLFHEMVNSIDGFSSLADLVRILPFSFCQLYVRNILSLKLSFLYSVMVMLTKTLMCYCSWI